MKKQVLQNITSLTLYFFGWAWSSYSSPAAGGAVSRGCTWGM